MNARNPSDRLRSGSEKDGTSPGDRRREFAVDVVRRLREAGHRALWAGGCVRDLLLGQAASDYDVATDATPEQVMSLFRRTVPVGLSFGVVRVLGPAGAGEVEVATFRSDGAYIDGRHPEEVSYGSPEEDASRRDFTINGMFLDPLTGEVIDYVGGKADLEAGILRAIGDPEARFAEDKLRLIRAVRFASRFGFAIDPRTKAALVAMASQIGVVAVERIAQELRRMLVHPSRARGMALAFETGLIAAILPDLVPLRGSKGEDGDRWESTLKVLKALPETPSFPLALAALLHRVGPSAPSESARILVERIGRELRLSNDERERTAWLAEHQNALRHPEALRPSQIKRLLATAGIEELIELHRAIALSAGNDLAHVAYCERYLADPPDGPINPSPLLTGTDLKNAGLQPGPRFAVILEGVRNAQLDGTIKAKEQALELARRLAEPEG